MVEKSAFYFGKHNNILLFLLSLVPIVIYFITVDRYAINLPYADDYDAILDFLIKYKHADRVLDKVILLFSQHNEHRIMPSRIVYVVYYWLTGTVNFRHLIFIANFQLLVIFAVIASFLGKYVRQYWWVSVFVLSLVTFDLNSYENANWAMAGMQNYGVVMFFLLSLFFYHRGGTYALIAAIICQVFCAFSSGNGMIAGLTLALFNLATRAKLKAVTSFLLFVVCTILYFAHFSSPKVGHGAPIVKVITFFLHTIGANFGFKLGVGGALVLLTGLLIFFPREGKWRIAPNATPLLAILFFVFASVGVTAFFRAGISMEVSYSTRYFVYPHLLLIIVFCFMIEGCRRRKWLKFAVLGSVLMLLVIYGISYQYGTAGFKRIQKCILTSNCYTDGSIPSKKVVAIEACKDQIFCAEIPK